MTYFLYIWLMTGGVITLPAEPTTYYTLDACNAAARKAENARLLFEGVVSKTQIRAYCSPKRLKGGANGE